jgi:soluble lytic murein transglycosylase
VTSSALILGSLSLIASPADFEDPRIELVEQQLAQAYREALARTEELLFSEPELADELWLRYLQGHLLEELGRTDDAHEAFARLLSAHSGLAAYARLRMALLQEEMGHPEVAAGLVATLLGRSPPDDTIPVATDLLVGALEKGADCRLLGRLPSWRIPEAERRRLQLSAAGCASRNGDSSGAAEILLELLRDRDDDLAARGAAQALSALPGPLRSDAETDLLIGMAFHRNREFERSTTFLGRGLAALDPERLLVSPEQVLSYRYADARGYFWLRRYAEAVSRFEDLARDAQRPELAADCLYQAGRSQELLGQWTLAATTFRRSYLADRTSEWSGPALLSAMRIEFRTGKEEPALELFRVLQSRAAWQPLAGRAALFLASSDLVRGRVDRAAGWLQVGAARNAIEVLYWRGRTAELEASPESAIRHYLEILRQAPHHPLAASARSRLANPKLAPLLPRIALSLSLSDRRADLHSAWLLLGDDSPEGAALRQDLEARLLLDARSAPYLQLALLHPRQWPLWQQPLTRPGERMLALGVWSPGEPYVLRHFPVSQPSLAFTGSAVLGQAGLTKRSMYVAEIMEQRVPSWLPRQLLPTAYRRLLYPYPYRDAIEAQARRFGIEPELLAALIREESRFDPSAESRASARGLTQFVYSTAQRYASTIGLRELRPEQLNDPEISIALGAAYLSDLLARFDGRLETAVTAYNAGEEQARVWRSYCYSRDPAEYFSKVGFPQSRSYLRKVLDSRSQYLELYGGV